MLLLLVTCQLTACGVPVAKNDAWSLYELHQQSGGKIVPPQDNDSYYSAPVNFGNCNNIGDAPSCAGGG